MQLKRIECLWKFMVTMLQLINHVGNGFDDSRMVTSASKVMLCIWWDQKGVVYYELLQPGDSITGDRYKLQLIRLSRALREKRPKYEQRHDKVILLHDNARLHVAKVVKKYLETLKWDILPHPPYSLDIAPSDYWLF